MNDMLFYTRNLKKKIAVVHNQPQMSVQTQQYKRHQYANNHSNANIIQSTLHERTMTFYDPEPFRFARDFFERGPLWTTVSCLLLFIRLNALLRCLAAK